MSIGLAGGRLFGPRARGLEVLASRGSEAALQTAIRCIAIVGFASGFSLG